MSYNWGPADSLRSVCTTILDKTYGRHVRDTKHDPKYWISRLKGHRALAVGPHSVRLAVPSIATYQEITFVAENEADLLEELRSELETDDVFLDVGANIGIHSILAATVAETVYAIEPHPVNASQLVRNRTTNDSRFDIYECALADCSGYVNLSGPRNGMAADGSAAFSHLRADSNASDGVLVRAERGDSFVEREELRAPTVVKIDVEGAEQSVIDGLEETFSDDRCRLLYCEVHEDLAEFDQIRSRLESLGFDTDVVDRRHRGRTIKATR